MYKYSDQIKKNVEKDRIRKEKLNDMQPFVFWSLAFAIVLFGFIVFSAMSRDVYYQPFQTETEKFEYTEKKIRLKLQQEENRLIKKYGLMP